MQVSVVSYSMAIVEFLLLWLLVSIVTGFILGAIVRKAKARMRLEPARETAELSAYHPAYSSSDRHVEYFGGGA